MKLITNKSKNLLYRIKDGGNVNVQFGTSYAIATQTSADTNTNIQYKCQYRKNTTYLRDVFGGAIISSTGKITRTFTTPADLDYNTIVFGLNGKIIDTLVSFPIKLKPSTTYTFTCNFTNITQGSISWKDMMLVEGSTVGDYEPYSYNLLNKWKFDTSNSNYINNGDGSITTTGTTFSYQRLFMDFDSEESSSISKENSIAYLTYGHKLLIDDNCNSTGTNQSNAAGCVWEINSRSDYAGSSHGGKGEIFTNNKLALADLKWSYFYITNNSGETVTCAPALYDLTLMYGEGNEPATVEQFYTDYPELKVSPLGFISLKNLEISNKNIKRLKYATTTRNLFDARSATILTAYIIPEASTVQHAYYDKTLVIPCEPNTPYTFSKQAVEPKARDRLCIAETSSENPEVGTSYTNAVSNGEPPKKNTVTITTTSTAKNLLVTIGYFDSDNITTLEMILATCQLEKGSTATPYVPYGYLDLGIIPSNSGYILDKYNNLSEELLEENIEKDNINYHIPDKTNILLNKIEGKTNKIVQLLDKTKYSATQTIDGVTFTNNGDGTITYNGVTSVGANYTLQSGLKVVSGHKYLSHVGENTNDKISVLLYANEDPYDTFDNRFPNADGGISTALKNSNELYYQPKPLSNISFSNFILKPQFFDLTAMYGFGKEPTTVEQFKKDYPQFFDEKLDGIWNVRTSGISTTGKNLFDINNVTDNNGGSSYSVSNYEILVTQNNKNTWSSANFSIKNSGELVGKTISISCLAKSSGINKPSIRVQWTTPNGLAVGNIAAISMPSTSTTFIELSASGTVPEKPAAADTLRFMFYSNSDGDLSGSTDSTFSCTYKDVQLEISDSATDYEPYQENKIDLLSTQTLNGINGVNDYIEVIDKGNGLYDLKKTQNIARVDMGSLGFDVDGNNFVTGAISSDIKTPVNDNTVGNYICQKYVNCALDKSFVNGDFGVNSSGYLYFRDSAYTTVSDFQTAVTGTMFYYQLKTPVTTTIATNLTYNQVSTIRTNGGLLLVNDNNNQKYVQPDVTLKANFQYKN